MKATMQQFQRGNGGQEDERGRPVRVTEGVRLPFWDPLFSVRSIISTDLTRSLRLNSVSSAPFFSYHSYGLQPFDS